ARRDRTVRALGNQSGAVRWLRAAAEIALMLTLVWKGELQFTAGPDGPPIELHSSTPGVTSPTQALAYAVMACMAMDVVHVLQKGRHDLQALTVSFESTDRKSTRLNSS